MQARYYDPVIGRFYSNDPVDSTRHNSVVHGFNRYAYANNNPYKYTDPDGRKPDSIMSRQLAPLMKAVGNAIGSKSLVRVGAKMTLDAKTMRAALTGDVKGYQLALKDYKKL
ncbi:RHS repeat-associated core domain-containing protein [Colwellia sp. E2M01]|uniref:RHS repeat-associated core domain-containing protein n=1 Tax=Colwellia sp. E2M01 TaxID=2841561 RepID=UPI002091D99F|nr:RHS repeat-associated core domain-containing protein [Colwellia sp. E2M01]